MSVDHDRRDPGESRGSRLRFKTVPGECPQGCETAGLRRVIHHTGQMQEVEDIFGEEILTEIVERHTECPQCGVHVQR